MNIQGFKKEWNICRVEAKQAISNKIEKNGQTQKCKAFFNFLSPRPDLPTKYDNCPDTLYVCVGNDVDLPKIHSTIKSKMIFLLIERNHLFDTGMKLTKLLDEEMDLDSIKDIRSKLQQIDREIEEIDEIVNRWPEYESKTVPLLNKYVEIMSDEISGSESGNSTESQEIIQERLNIIMEYIAIITVMDLITVNMTYKYDEMNSCPSCGANISELEMDSDRKYVCSCGYMEDNITQSNSNQPDTIKLSVQKPKPDILIAMETWLNRFLGTSDDTFKEREMFQKFDEVCREKGWPTGEEVRNGNDEDCDLQRLLDIMLLAKCSKYYKIRNIIRHKYWGWPLPSMTDAQKSRFLLKIVESQAVYHKYALRKHNINQDIRGWYHLNDAGCHFPKSWFKMTKTQATLEEADLVYSQICRDCNMTFYPVL